MSATARRLADGRLHLNHGPIDMIVEAWGDAACVETGYANAIRCFESLLETLVEELPGLRSTVPVPLHGRVARRMAAAVAPFRPAVITPMAAVAGAGAEVLLDALVAEGGIDRAYVNNGGDIALHLGQGQRLTAAIAARPGLPDRVTVRAEDPVRGIATSGWRGRSQSLGIADAVTVLAPTAAMADAATTMIANAVDLPGHPAVIRRPACDLKADSDLGDLPVTVAVSALTMVEAARALDHGLSFARACRQRGLITAAALFLAGEVRTCGPFPARLPETAFA